MDYMRLFLICMISPCFIFGWFVVCLVFMFRGELLRVLFIGIRCLGRLIPPKLFSSLLPLLGW